MKRAKVKNIDYWTYILAVSAVLIFFVFKSMGLIVELSQTVEIELHRVIRGFAVLVVPVYAMFFCAVAFTLLSALFLRKTHAVDGIIPSILVGLSFIVVGFINDAAWPYCFGAAIGVYAWFYVVKYLSLFIIGMPVIVDSQTWSLSSLDYQHRAPDYWVYVLNILYILSALSFPVFIVYSFSLQEASWAAALIASSIATSLGLFYLKREKSLGYVFYIVPVACSVLYFFPAQGGFSAFLSTDLQTLSKIVFATIPVVMVGLSCCVSWSRLIGEAFDAFDD